MIINPDPLGWVEVPQQFPTTTDRRFDGCLGLDAGLARQPPTTTGRGRGRSPGGASGGYQDKQAAPATVAAIEGAGLGGGLCVIRRDRTQVFIAGVERTLDAEHRARYRDPDYWGEDTISVHCLSVPEMNSMRGGEVPTAVERLIRQVIGESRADQAALNDMLLRRHGPPA